MASRATGRRARLKEAARRATCIVASAALAVSVACTTGCKSTDFLKRIVTVTEADSYDPNNVTLFNSPDAEVESTEFPAFELAEAQGKTSATQRVVVYGSKPSSELPTRHSVFDTAPRFPGTEASDSVRLVASDQSNAIDHEVQSDIKPARGKSRSEKEDAEKTEKSDKGNSEKKTKETGKSGKGKSEKKDAKEGASGSDGSSEGSATAKGGSGGAKKGGGSSKGSKDGGSGQAGKAEKKKSDGTADKTGGDTGAGDDGKSSGDAGDKGSGSVDKGTSARESGGYGGEDLVVDPGNRLADIPKVERIAAIGQAAVIVQAVGGEGALAAMDEYTYAGKAASGNDATYASSFAEVFSDELADGFESDALLWRYDGSSPGYLSDVKALVAAATDGGKSAGIVMFPGDEGSQKDYFSSSQLKAFKKAQVALMPVDLSSAQGIVEAVSAAGAALSESTAAKQDAKANADLYTEATKSILEGAAATHGGKLAVSNESSKVAYGKVPGVSLGTRTFKVYGTVATGFESGVRFEHKDYKVDTTGGVLFVDLDSNLSPLSYYMQVAGVVNKAAETSSSQFGTLFPLLGNEVGFYSKDNFSGYSSDGPFSRMAQWKKVRPAEMLQGEDLAGGDMKLMSEYGFGSLEYPYLVVSATEQESAAEVKADVLASAKDKDTPYYPYKFSGGGWDACCKEVQTNPNGEKVELRGYVGDEQGYEGNVFRDLGVSLSDSVRENPAGLIGTWTKGSMESVLESVWLADLYSKSPENSHYEPINDFSGFSCTIGSTECMSVKQAVQAFYKEVYRCGASVYSYGDVVTDTCGGLK